MYIELMYKIKICQIGKRVRRLVLSLLHLFVVGVVVEPFPPAGAVCPDQLLWRLLLPHRLGFVYSPFSCRFFFVVGFRTRGVVGFSNSLSTRREQFVLTGYPGASRSPLEERWFRTDYIPSSCHALPGASLGGGAVSSGEASGVAGVLLSSWCFASWWAAFSGVVGHW